jgi:hypothetical protein
VYGENSTERRSTDPTEVETEAIALGVGGFAVTFAGNLIGEGGRSRCSTIFTGCLGRYFAVTYVVFLGAIF